MRIGFEREVNQADNLRSAAAFYGQAWMAAFMLWLWHETIRFIHYLRRPPAAGWLAIKFSAGSALFFIFRKFPDVGA